MANDISQMMSSGQLARLIPTVADSKKEERATSSLLASFMVVPIFAKSILADAGAPTGKRLKISCYTEVTFKSSDKSKNPRPDGLIVIKSGAKTWTALVESKIGTAELTVEQVETYLELAKQHGIDAVITISNQFATTPAHHPLKVSRQLLKSVDLYHFSWLSLKSKAVLLTSNHHIEDPEQAFILNELVRYLDHDSSGVSSLTKMPSEWKVLCDMVQHGALLKKNDENVQGAVSGWHQLSRHLALTMSMAVGRAVLVSLTRAREKDAELNFTEDCLSLSNTNILEAEFEIPNAAAKLFFSADVTRKTLNIAMKLEAPKDKSRATASINWLMRQLKDTDGSGLSIRAYWPKRIAMTTGTLEAVLEDPTVLLPEKKGELPTYLEVVRVVDLAGRFKGSKTFIEEASKHFIAYYQDAGQHLSKWVPQAPKVKPVSVIESLATVVTEPLEEHISTSEADLPSDATLAAAGEGTSDPQLDQSKVAEDGVVS